MSVLPSETHGDGTGSDFGDASSEDDGGSSIGARETSGKGKRNGEAIGNTDDDVTDDFTGGEVLFSVAIEKALFLRFKV